MVMLPAQMIKDIEDYKDEHRLRTRNQTIRTLIQKGLEDTQED